MSIFHATGLNEKIQDLEETSGKLTEFDDCCKNVNALLKKLEDKMDAHNRLGSSAKDPKHQDKIRVSVHAMPTFTYCLLNHSSVMSG